MWAWVLTTINGHMECVHNKIDLKYLQKMEHNKKGNLTNYFMLIILIPNGKFNLFLLIHHGIMYKSQVNRTEYMCTNPSSGSLRLGANFSNSIYFSFEWWIYWIEIAFHCVILMWTQKSLLNCCFFLYSVILYPMWLK